MQFLENNIHLNNEHIEMGTVLKQYYLWALRSSPVFSPSANQSQHQEKTTSWRIYWLPKDACMSSQAIQENNSTRSGYRIHMRKLWDLLLQE